MTEIEKQCTDAGVSLADAKRIEEAVRGFDSDVIRQRAVETLIAAWLRCQELNPVMAEIGRRPREKQWPGKTGPRSRRQA